MVKNYLTIAFRNLVKYKSYSFINVFGLAMGMAGCLIILVFIRQELSYDRYHRNSERIFRIAQEYPGRFGGTKKTALTPGPLGATLVQEMPEVLQATRLYTYSWKESVLMRTGEKKFYEDRLFLADPQIFQVFDLPFVYGDPATALTMPNALVMSEEMARKYFGSEDPIGKTISMTIYDSYDFVVTGVMQNMPQNSHFRADFFAPLKSGSFLFWKEFAGDWRSADFYTYLLLAEDSRLPELEQSINTIYARFTDISGRSIFLQPLTNIHLSSDLADEIEINGSMGTLYSLGLLGATILIIACVNITNLALARTVARRREFVLRKVVGAKRSHILTQYLCEVILLAF